MEATAGGKAGLVLAGGGARAAYQVGVLQALQEILPDPQRESLPDHLRHLRRRGECGRARGARRRLRPRGDNLLEVWRNFEPRHVYRADFPGVAPTARAGSAASSSARSLAQQAHLAARQPRRSRRCSPRTSTSTRIAAATSRPARSMRSSITCSGYTSGQSCSFFEGADAPGGLEALAAHRHPHAHRACST